ncbi:hypothetical protein [Lysinibacillus sp. BPa_S21]|uniref:hypothetical protein n=1 Tax=Lysinibacillus sp. BPa_S21 TaxID=2932478 RepID=UPI0020110D8A|nr:hypothetical protein [Lysinibacillus sp. BPa_S21]MCL1696407.1 hypothetical protein [Lysinibacillus sp. BPa_S21]
MLFFTIAIIIWWALATFSTDMFRNMSVRNKKGEIKDNEMMGGCFLYFTFGLTYLLGYLIYLLYALKYDPFLYPTYFMIVIYVIGFLISMLLILFSRITGKKRELKEKTSIRSYLSRFLTLAYFGYMLWVVIS